MIVNLETELLLAGHDIKCEDFVPYWVQILLYVFSLEVFFAELKHDIGI